MFRLFYCLTQNTHKSSDKCNMKLGCFAHSNWSVCMIIEEVVKHQHVFAGD